MASNYSSDDGYYSADLLVALNSNIKGQWVLNSRCSFNMYPDRSLFYKYGFVNRGRVLMGNNNVCQIVGIEYVKIKMFDGSIIILYNVRHAPRLKRNLSSLDLLDGLGYFFRSKNGGLKIIKRIEVVIKGVKKHDLYVLEGSSISVSTAILVVF